MNLLAPNTRSVHVADSLTQMEHALTQGDWPTAVHHAKNAEIASPWDAQVLHASGLLCEMGDMPEAALTQWIHAVSMDHKLAESWSALGTLFSRGYLPDAPHLALLAFAQAALHRPAWILPAWHLTLAYHALGHFDAAALCVQRVEKLVHDYSDHRANRGVTNVHNRAYMHLALGQYEQGFANYEARLYDKGHVLNDRARTRPPEGVPMWTDASVRPKRLAVFAEQGAGDMLMILRYARQLANEGVTVVLETFASLTHFSRVRVATGTDGMSVIPLDAGLPKVDAYVWAMSLPGLIWTGPNDIPRMWCNPYQTSDRPYVAFAWQGSRAHRSDKIRSCPPDTWRAIAEMCRANGYTPIAVNVGEKTPDYLDEAPRELATFEDTAIVLEQCAAVVSVDTALVHLAGSMNIPTYAALAALPDWRWGLKDQGPRWYESVTLVRQPVLGDWTSVAESILTQLSTILPPRT